MVIVKTILGEFDTSTKSFLQQPKVKSTAPLGESFKSFKLVTAPPRIIPVSRLATGVIEKLRRETPVQEARTRPDKFKRVVNIRGKARQESIRDIFRRRSRR